MILPGLFISFLLSSLYGLLFHFWRGGNGGRLILYLIFSWIGFWIGHTLGNYFGLTFFSLGVIRLGMASIGSFFILGIGYFLSQIDTRSVE